MKCQNCGRFEANFHFSSNINGDVTERHLCSECAERMGYASMGLFRPEMEFESFFGGMLSRMRSFWPSFGVNMPRPVSARPQMGILERQAAPAVPDTETEVDEEMKKRRELNMLREEMRIAAEREDFERAIELREELKKYEG